MGIFSKKNAKAKIVKAKKGEAKKAKKKEAVKRTRRLDDQDRF